jgi:hypothetical protein
MPQVIFAPSINTLERQILLVNSSTLDEQPPKFWQLLRRSWPTIPQKPLLLSSVSPQAVLPVLNYNTSVQDDSWCPRKLRLKWIVLLDTSVPALSICS